MIDTETQARLIVHEDGNAGPYLMVPLDQLNALRKVLRENNICYTVVPDAIQLEGKPVIAIVDFNRDENVALIQAALDSA